MADQINLLDLVALSEVSIKPPEHSDDRATRLEAERRDLRIKAYEGVVIFGVFVVFTLVAISLCIYRMFFEMQATDDAKRQALALMIPFITGIISFLAGRKIGSK